MSTVWWRLRVKQALLQMNKIVCNTLPLVQVTIPENISCSIPVRGYWRASARSVPKYVRTKTLAESNLCESPSSEASHPAGAGCSRDLDSPS